MSSRRNRNNNTFVNNVRGPTSALTSFLNERGIRRANPAPAPPPEPETNTEIEEGEESAAADSTASNTAPAISRPTRSRTTQPAAVSASTSRSESIDIDGDDDDEDDDDDDDDDEDAVALVPIQVTVRNTRATRARATASTSEASSSKTAVATPSKKRPRKKKDDSDDSGDGDFQDITGFVTRSKFSHKGRMPQGSNKIEFCSRCRARFTVKAGTTPAMDDDGALLCPTCASPNTVKEKAAKPVKRPRRKAQKAEVECQVPSLQDLCIQKIANCIEDVEAFGDISDLSMDKICKIISRNRSLTTETVQLFLDSRHTELKLYDCTDITSLGLQNIAQLCPNLRTLNLNFCGRITDEVMDVYVTHLRRLSSLTLVGPILITDAAYIRLFEALGDQFTHFDLQHSARFSIAALEVLVRKCPKLSYLRLGDCDKMDDAWLELISNLTCLTTLGLRNPVHSLSPEAVTKLIQSVGSGLEELDLLGCTSLEDTVLVEGIRPSCVRLERLNLTECEHLTTEGVTSLFTDWTLNRGLTRLYLKNCVMLKDEAFMAMTAHSAQTLEELDMNGLDEITREGLLTLTRCENLVKLDASWCRAMDDEVMEQLIKSALKLSVVAVWGDHRLTECCPTREGMKVVGREGDYVGFGFQRS